MLAGGLATVILAQPAELTDALGFAAKSPDIRGILVQPGALALRAKSSATGLELPHCLSQQHQAECPHPPF